MFKRLFLSIMAALILGIGATATHADTFTVVGNSNPNATATLNIISLSNNQLVISVTNTSGGVVTGFGFDLHGINTQFSLVSATPQLGHQNFVFSTSVGNVPQFNNAALSFAMVTHNGNFAGGNPPSGIQAGATSAIFTFSGNFTGMTQQQIALALYVRFQALTSNPSSDVGRVNGVTPSAVPEPTTMLLLGSGLAGVAGVVKKRRKKKNQ